MALFGCSSEGFEFVVEFEDDDLGLIAIVAWK